ncbi:MAG: hypothetical protein WBC68_07490 [Albidovulum sp.]
MKPERRWIKWVLAESAKQGTPLPWQRGTRQTATSFHKPARATGLPARS